MNRKRKTRKQLLVLERRAFGFYQGMSRSQVVTEIKRTLGEPLPVQVDGGRGDYLSSWTLCVILAALMGGEE